MNKLQKTTIVILSFGAIVFWGLNIYISNTRGIDSIHAAKLVQKVKELSESNVNLESEILSYSSYNFISSKAAELGYRVNKEFVSVYDPVTLASGR